MSAGHELTLSVLHFLYLFFPCVDSSSLSTLFIHNANRNVVFPLLFRSRLNLIYDGKEGEWAVVKRS